MGSRGNFRSTNRPLSIKGTNAQTYADANLLKMKVLDLMSTYFVENVDNSLAFCKHYLIALTDCGLSLFITV